MEKNMGTCIAILVICMACCMVNASDPDPLQDICVAAQDPKSAVFVNGLFCKDPKTVTVKDFAYKGFNAVANTNNTLQANATLVDVNKFPALNTQGVAIAHIDYGPYGLNTPHHHPRSSEVFTVVYGTLYAGFITTDYKLFSMILKPGDVFLFPQGLVHFQYNTKKDPARAIAAFGSQNPGRVNSVQSLFGVSPSILDDVLTKAYQVDEVVIDELRSQFSNALNAIDMERVRNKGMHPDI